MILVEEGKMNDKISARMKAASCPTSSLSTPRLELQRCLNRVQSESVYFHHCMSQPEMCLKIDWLFSIYWSGSRFVGVEHSHASRNY